MTLDEAQSVWNEQPVRSVDQLAALRHLTKAHRAVVSGILMLAVSLTSCCLTLWRQVNRALADNDYTFANSSIDMGMSVAGIVMTVLGLAYLLRLRRDLRTLQNDTVKCLDRLIRGVRFDVRFIRHFLPLMLSGIVLLGVLSRVQLIRGGVQFSDGWSEFIMVGIGILALYAASSYRLHVHILPRLENLEAIQRDLAKRF